jgi:hypothetical protein
MALDINSNIGTLLVKGDLDIEMTRIANQIITKIENLEVRTRAVQETTEIPRIIKAIDIVIIDDLR